MGIAQSDRWRSTDQCIDTLRVLVVEDHAGTAECLQCLLKSWSCSIQVHGNGVDGVAAAADFRPRVALVDLGLPDMDGCEVARRLSRNHPAPLLISLGAPDQASLRESADASIFDFHLVVPIDPDQLGRALTEAVHDCEPRAGDIAAPEGEHVPSRSSWQGTRMGFRTDSMSVDLTTHYLGLKLRNPIVIGAGPVTMELHRLEQLEAAGASAVVLASLFAEEIEASDLSTRATEGRGPPAMVTANEFYRYNGGSDAYLRHIESAKRALSIPVIATLNGTCIGNWIRFARLIEQAGADALELNIYAVSTHPDEDSAAVEHKYIDLVRAVRSLIKIPLAVKVGPFFSSLPNVAKRLVEAGADGLVLFNRFVQSDIDLDSLALIPRLASGSRERLCLPVYWIAILRQQLKVSLAAVGGIHFAEDLLKVILAGADVGMLTSAGDHDGPEHVRTILAEIHWWLAQHHFETLEQAAGLVRHEPWVDSSAFERGDYIRTLISRSSDSI
jgi:dihydroorotate dehydrogenase (fumarate)